MFRVELNDVLTQIQPVFSHWASQIAPVATGKVVG